MRVARRRKSLPCASPWVSFAREFLVVSSSSSALSTSPPPINSTTIFSGESKRRRSLRPRCPCLGSLSQEAHVSLIRKWADVLFDVQNEFSSSASTFGVLALPQLTIHSREPDTLFIENEPLLNRQPLPLPSTLLQKGSHVCGEMALESTNGWTQLQSFRDGSLQGRVLLSFEGEFLRRLEWRRLVPISEPCPTTITARLRHKASGCDSRQQRRELRRQRLHPDLGENSFEGISESSSVSGRGREERAGIVFFVALLCVSSLGTVFYCHGLKSAQGRFELAPGV